jgi:uncharacterized protein (TIGR02246 family)
MRAIGLLPVMMMCAAPALAQSSAERAVQAAMVDSAAGWNAGDLDRFMAVYSASPGTTYVTPTGLARGKAAIAARYRDYFGGAKTAERGKLSFETLDFQQIDQTHALLIARYHVSPAGTRTKEWSGSTTLLFAREATGWHIVADHSS